MVFQFSIFDLFIFFFFMKFNFSFSRCFLELYSCFFFCDFFYKIYSCPTDTERNKNTLKNNVEYPFLISFFYFFGERCPSTIQIRRRFNPLTTYAQLTRNVEQRNGRHSPRVVQQQQRKQQQQQQHEK